MKRIKAWIKAFIIKTVVDDYQSNGKTRQTLKGDLDGPSFIKAREGSRGECIPYRRKLNTP